MSEKQKGLSKEDSRIFAGCSYLYLINGIMALMVGALQPYLRSSYQISYEMSGFLISSHSIGNLISSFVSGLLPLYLGRRKSMLILCSAGVLAFLLILITGNPLFLILAFFLTGINRGAISNFNNAVITDVATGKAWALNLLHGVYCLGAFFGPLLVLFCARSGANTWTLAVLLELILLVSQLPMLLKLNIPRNHPRKKTGSSSGMGFLRHPCFLAACCILFSYLAAEQAVNGWLIVYLQDSGIMSPEFSQIMASVLWIVMLVGRLLSALITTRVKKSVFLLGSAAGYLIFFCLLLFGRSPLTSAAGVIGIGLFMAGLYPTTVADVGDLAEEYPMALSFLMTFGSLGAILMPSVIGLISQRIGILGGMSTVIIAVAAAFLSIVWNAWLRRGSGGSDAVR